MRRFGFASQTLPQLVLRSREVEAELAVQLDIVSIVSFPSMSFRPKVPTTTAFFGVEDTVDAVE